MIPLKKWGWGWVDLIFPARCYFCGIDLGRRDEAVCPDCLAKVHYLRSPLCSCCGREFPAASGGDHLCGTCLRQPPVYAWARAAVRYEEPVSRLLHRLKYAADSRTLPVLAQVVAAFAATLSRDFHAEADRIVPVPLFSARLKKRGLNQSLLLAGTLFPHAGEALLVDALRRIRNTPPQTTLNGLARRKNLGGAFAVANPDAIIGRRIFLVDDVLTTGTTVTECGKALLAAGAAEIYVVTVARVAERR
jgi:ComF family protein